MSKESEQLREHAMTPYGYGDLDGTYDLHQESVAFISHSYQTNRYDRLEGRYLPVYHTENDLRVIVQLGRLLFTRVPMAKAFAGRLKDYTIGTGFDWSIESENEKLAAGATKAVELFFKNNNWDDWEVESFEQEVVEGDYMAELNGDDGDIALLTYTGDQIVEPLQTRELEEYYSEYSDRWGALNWRFGILTPENATDKPLAYHVFRNDSGTDWDLVDAQKFVHWKRNVWPKAKRGISDFYTPHVYLGRADKVGANTSEGAAIQAAIAYIVEHVPGTTAKQVNKIIGNYVNAPGRDPVTGKTEGRRVVRPGQRVDIPAGMKYHAAPLGGVNSQIYIEVMEAMLRLCASIYGMPEHMITGSAENNNLASIKEAGSPFIQGRKSDQKRRGARLKAMIQKVLYLSAEIGILKADKAQIDKELEIVVSPPDIFEEDGKALSERLLMEVQGGLVSKRTASNKLGYDYEDEKELIDKDQEDMAAQGGPLDPLGLNPQSGQDGEEGDEPPQEPPDEPEDPRGPNAGEDRENAREGLSERQRVLLDAWHDYDTIVENCGTGAGGFQPGNTCAAGGGGADPRAQAPGESMDDWLDRLEAGNLSQADVNRVEKRRRELEKARQDAIADIRNAGQAQAPGPEPPKNPEPSRGGISKVEAIGLDTLVDRAGGFTYQPLDDESPTSGYALSIYPEHEAVFGSDISEDDIYDYLKARVHMFEDERVHVGGWHDTEAGKVYLDLSVVLDDRDEAVTLARDHNQEGIYDLGKGETIITKDQATRRLGEAFREAVRLSHPEASQEDLFHAQAIYEVLVENCGANAPGGGGFQPGNTCASGDGGGTSSSVGKRRSTTGSGERRKARDIDYNEYKAAVKAGPEAMGDLMAQVHPSEWQTVSSELRDLGAEREDMRAASRRASQKEKEFTRQQAIRDIKGQSTDDLLDKWWKHDDGTEKIWGSDERNALIEELSVRLKDNPEYSEDLLAIQAEDYQQRGTKAKAFRDWFGDWDKGEDSSQVVRSAGDPETTAPYSVVVDDQGEPRVAYHGTTHDFDAFNLERGNPENHMGRGHYFTTDTGDANMNYAGHGPDLTQRITMEAERIEYDVKEAMDEIDSQTSDVWETYQEAKDVPADRWDEMRDVGMEVAESYGWTGDQAKVLADYAQSSDQADADELARKIADEKLAGDSPKMIEAYLNVRNPMVMGSPNYGSGVSRGAKGETQFDFRYEEEDYEGRTPDDPEFDPDTAEITGVGGKGWEFMEAVKDGFARHDVDTSSLDEIAQLGVDYEGIPAGELMSRIKSSDAAMQILDYGYGDPSANAGDIIGEALRKVGFDGIKYQDAGQHFPHMQGTHGAEHWIVWDSSQIKARDNRGSFEPQNPKFMEASGCGANAPGGGGFQQGNTCATGSGSSGKSQGWQYQPKDDSGEYVSTTNSGGTTYSELDDVMSRHGFDPDEMMRGGASQTALYLEDSYALGMMSDVYGKDSKEFKDTKARADDRQLEAVKAMTELEDPLSASSAEDVDKVVRAYAALEEAQAIDMGKIAASLYGPGKSIHSGAGDFATAYMDLALGDMQPENKKLMEKVWWDTVEAEVFPDGGTKEELAILSDSELDALYGGMPKDRELFDKLGDWIETEKAASDAAKQKAIADRAYASTTNESPREFINRALDVRNSDEGNKGLDAAMQHRFDSVPGLNPHVTSEGKWQATSRERGILKDRIGRLNGYKILKDESVDRTKMVAAVERGLLGEDIRERYLQNIGGQDPMNEDVAAAVAVSAGLQDAWARSSTNGSVASLSMQIAVAKKFGDSPHIHADSEGAYSEAMAMYQGNKEVMDAYVTAVYDRTQKLLADQGVKELTLVRGLSVAKKAKQYGRRDEGYMELSKRLDDREQGLEGNIGSWGNRGLVYDSKIEGNPISSWTTATPIASDFAGSSSDHQVMLTSIVKAEDIFATSSTGPGCLTESEVLVRRHGQKAKAYQVAGDKPRGWADLAMAIGSSSDEFERKR